MAENPDQQSEGRQPRTALLVVDVQPTFCEGGALPVEGGNAVASRVADLLAGEHGYDLVVTTQDWHIDPGDHFSDQPDFVDTWPPHGVAGTAEAELHPALGAVADRIDAGVRKGMHAAAYSGFEGVDNDGRTLNDVLSAAGVHEVDVVGIAFDHCVRATAMDAAANGYATTVIDGLSASVAPETEAAARSQLAGAGIDVIASR
ncbi:isochorismatase family protein [Candidatus Poriferisodalis sp.]|uniref:isochorismatase family protein n=1 Tax=Candidatus Poriferisodalis sp. TaxID=3101277 RepID=UPI003B0271FA